MFERQKDQSAACHGAGSYVVRKEDGQERDFIMKQDIQVRKAMEADIDCIEKLYEDICDYLEMHKNYPRWEKGIYPAVAMQKRDWRQIRCTLPRWGRKR